MENYVNEIDNLERQWADFIPMILDKKDEVERIDLSMYKTEYQQELREEHYSKAKSEIDTIIERFEKDIEKIRDNMAKDSFSNSTLLKERQQFAADHNLTLTEAEAYLDKYIKTADLDEITNERSPYHKLFMAELVKSGRDAGGAYSKVIDETRTLVNASKKLDWIANRASEIKRAPLRIVPINSGDIILSELTQKKYKK